MLYNVFFGMYINFFKLNVFIFVIIVSIIFGDLLVILRIRIDCFVVGCVVLDGIVIGYYWNLE